MDPEKEFELVLRALAIKGNRMYMEAIARLYEVSIQTVWIWHAVGKV